MPDLADGEEAEVQGSGSNVYTLKNSGGVYSCSCPAWRNQGAGIERRTCKHLRNYRGDEAERERIGAAELAPRAKAANGDVEGPPILLAHRWEAEDLTGWWLSEKLDGVRAYWDGSRFLSRLGNEFFAPEWFTQKLPKTVLDGELWGGRKQFQRTVGIVKRQDRSPLWKDLLFVVFDAPTHDGVFEDRLAHCESLLDASEYARFHEHHQCRGHDHLKEELARVEALGGEGLMARRPKSRYEVGRSSSLLKVKSFKDAEARVLGHAAGAGRHKGRLGALEVELEDGTRFNVGTGFSDAEREDPPPIGSIITFRYQELSDGGVPRFPSYVGIRADAQWKGKAAPAPVVSVSAARAPAKRVAATSSSLQRRRFEMEDGDTRYFWEIEQDGARHRVRYGTFEQKTKRFGSEGEAKEALAERIAEKIERGFREVEEE
jgi:DNA ligase-1